MRNIRAVAGSVVVSGCLFAGGLYAVPAAAQTAEPVGRPLQLLQLMHAGKSQANSSTKPAPASTRSATKHDAKTHTAEKRTSRSHTVVAERKRHRLAAEARATEPPAPANTSEAVAASPSVAAPTATTVDAVTLAPKPLAPKAQAPTSQAAQAATLPQPAAAPPEAAAPQVETPVAASSPGQLVVNGQTVQVASADEANEIDLAANDATAAHDATLGAKPAGNAVTTAAAAPPASLNLASETTSAEPPKAASGTAWLLQVLAALGGAVAAGAVAWFLIASTPQRTLG